MSYIECFVDGSSRGQGKKKLGEAACAVVIYKNRREIFQYARGLGPRTNNEAEYEAVLTALQVCVMSDLPRPIIYSDSAVVVNQVNNKWSLGMNSADRLLPLLLSIRSIQESYPFHLVQVPRNLVAEPDHLSNVFLDELAKEKEILVSRYEKARRVS